ncbi:hypothetical protein [Oxynema aestuarii]|nr:hypothetical protein [Oxynema aestuarii]
MLTELLDKKIEAGDVMAVEARSPVHPTRTDWPPRSNPRPRK